MLPAGFVRSHPTMIYDGRDNGGYDDHDLGFWSGHRFRTFKELSIAPGATYVIRATVPINIQFMFMAVDLDDGWLRIGTYVGGTPGGVFAEALPRFAVNNRTDKPQPPYVPQVLLEAGGTHVDGTELDVIRVRTANATGSVSSVGGSQDSERGVGPGTYYFRLFNLGTNDAVGTFRARWEERP